jgi:hypothetical protein
MHLLYASGCQGCGHGDLSLSNRTLDLDVPHMFQRASGALRSTLEVIRYPACLPQIGCDGVQVARLLYAFPWKTRTNAPSKGRGVPAVSPHLELRLISVPPSMLHRNSLSPPQNSPQNSPKYIDAMPSCAFLRLLSEGLGSQRIWANTSSGRGTEKIGSG